MRRNQFQNWLSRVDALTKAQREAALAAVELGVDEERRCPRCDTPGAVGKARGLRRYLCKKGCGRTALTGTPLSRLRHKERWLSFGEALAEGETVKASSERCGVAVTTAFRWRHRRRWRPLRTSSCVEADETWPAGERKLEARRRGGKAGKRSLSREQVPVLVAADRSGATASTVLPAADADALTEALEPVVDKDVLLVSDGHKGYPACAAALGVRHEVLNLSAGERVRGTIQTVNSRHSQLKGFLRQYRGVATRYLKSYLRWFHLIVLGSEVSPRACLAAAMGGLSIHNAN